MVAYNCADRCQYVAVPPLFSAVMPLLYGAVFQEKSELDQVLGRREAKSRC
jgi:hypothetical protein